MIAHASARTNRRRGAALLLVLVALAVGLLLVATWLDGRRESVPIARQVATGTTTRLAASSGLDLAVATLDAEYDWRDALVSGRFAGTMPIDDANVAFEILDADTAESPDPETTRLRVTCIARLDDAVATATRVIDVATANPVLDLGFGEAAIVVERTLRIDDEAALLPWTARPGGGNAPMVVGSLDGRVDAVVVAGNAIVLDAEVLEVRGRGGGSAGGRVLPDSLPAILPPKVPGPDPDHTLPGRLPIDLAVAPTADVVSSDVRIPGSARLEFDGDRVIRSLGDLVLEHGATISVDHGTLVLDAVGDLSVRGAEITVASGAHLVLRAGRELRIDDSVLAPASVDPADVAREFPPLGPERDAITATVGQMDATIEIGGRTAAVLAVLAPGGGVAIEDDAVLHGRILAADVHLRDRATVYALPDDGRVIGLTTPLGPHRDDDGRLIASVTASDRGSAAGLARVAADTGLETVAFDRVAVPDPEVVERLRETMHDRLRRALDERRRRRAGSRWARGGDD